MLCLSFIPSHLSGWNWAHCWPPSLAVLQFHGNNITNIVVGGFLVACRHRGMFCYTLLFESLLESPFLVSCAEPEDHINAAEVVSVPLSKTLITMSRQISHSSDRIWVAWTTNLLMCNNSSEFCSILCYQTFIQKLKFLASLELLIWAFISEPELKILRIFHKIGKGVLILMVLHHQIQQQTWFVAERVKGIMGHNQRQSCKYCQMQTSGRYAGNQVSSYSQMIQIGSSSMFHKARHQQSQWVFTAICCWIHDLQLVSKTSTSHCQQWICQPLHFLAPYKIQCEF